jgi:hypothetical protein
MSAKGNSNGGSFWTSLSGMLTALAALITAVVGLWAAIHHGQTARKQRGVDHPQAKFRVVNVILRADPANYNGPCPVTINFRGRIEAADGPGSVSYKFLRSDSADAPVSSASFAGTGNQAVFSSWSLGRTYSGWQQVQILDPGNLTSANADFSVHCQ